MNTLLLIVSLLLASGLIACHKNAAPAQADMNAESRQKAIEVRAAADKKTAVANGAAAAQTSEPQKTTTPAPKKPETRPAAPVVRQDQR